MKSIYKVTLSFLSLTIGGLLYLGYRTNDLLMFRWGESLGVDMYIKEWRILCSQINLPEWTYYSLPDGLWLFSYMLIINCVWKRHCTSYYVWLYSLPIIALFLELLQVWVKSLGTFDFFDVLSYLCAIILFKILIIWQEKEISSL